MRGQRHIIRSRLSPARDGGEQSHKRGSLRCRSSVLTAVVEPTLPIYKQVHHTEWVRVDRGLRRPQGGSRECERGYVAPARGPVMRIGAGTDTGGEVTSPAAYVPRDSFEAISDARTRDAMGTYSARSTPFPTSPPISGTLTPYTNRDMSPQEPDVRRDDERRYLVGIPDVYSFQPLAAREATPWASKTRATCTR